jgi:hypothetical protein
MPAVDGSLGTTGDVFCGFSSEGRGVATAHAKTREQPGGGDIHELGCLIHSSNGGNQA